MVFWNSCIRLHSLQPHMQHLTSSTFVILATLVGVEFRFYYFIILFFIFFFEFRF